jgi:hypothetical protein
MRIANRLLPAVLAFAAIVCAPTVRGDTDPAPRQRSQGPIDYVVGGIGADQAEAMREAEASYPLTLELAARSDEGRDEFIADARVAIHDLHGQALLSTKVDGPLILIRLPSGNYDVEVDWNGTVKRRTVAITSAKRQHIVFEFPPESTP